MHADRTFAIADRASELMRAYACSASPRSYELWYTFVTGLKPQLNEAAKRLIAAQHKLSSDDIDELYEAHLGDSRMAVQADKSGTGLLLEIDQVLGMIETAIGSTTEYGASLAAISGDLAGPVERPRLRSIVEALVAATREVAANNSALEGRLKESRREIESLHGLLEDCRHETLTDSLTGISNRKHFEATLLREVAACQRQSHPLTLIVIDIDEFKRFNDLYGHLTGDQVLRLVAEAMRDNVAPGATLARFGGEEFSIIMPRIELEAAFGSAEKIRGNVMRRELLKRSTGASLGRVTVSVGVASLRAGEPATALLDRADLCMYRAKRMGRNRTVTDEDTDGAAVSTAA